MLDRQSSATAEIVDAPRAEFPAQAGLAGPHHRLAILLGCCSAFGYTLANICLRQVADCDPIWVSCIKALPTVLLVLPWAVVYILQRRALITSGRDLATVLLGAIIAQLLGNCLFQWSLGVVGLALAVPVTLGAILIGGGLLSRHLLGEPVNRQAWSAIGILMLAIALLSLGAGTAYRSMHRGGAMAFADYLTVSAGILGFVVAGFAFSTLGATIRRVSLRGLPQVTVLLVSGLVGVVGLGLILPLTSGWEVVAQTTSVEWGWMLAAGLFNALAFFALTSAIRSISLLNVNALNASQTAMAAVAGVFLFGEPVTWTLLVGVGLTVWGLLSMPRTARRVA